MRKLVRVDRSMVDQGVAESLDQARRLVMAGLVRVGDEVVVNPSRKIPRASKISLVDGQRFASRGGDKLQGALDRFSVKVAGKICADVGASTGGFTDCLLHHGAKKVYAIDVAYGLLDWQVRQDPRVVVMERTNVRYLERLPEPVDLITIDVSFISLKKILPVIRRWFPDRGGTALILIKPQFEAGREEAARGSGVIRDPDIHQRVLGEVLLEAQGHGFQVKNIIRSPLLGPDGNVEFFAWLEVTDPAAITGKPDRLISRLF